MKILMLVIDQQRVQLECFYEGIAQNCDLDLRRLSKKEQANLSKYFKKSVNTSLYERIIFFTRFKTQLRQVAFLRKVPNLILLEHDAWQNYYPHSKYKNKFSRHYRSLPWARILVSGATLAERLRNEGHEAIFIPKGYDQNILKNTHENRGIELGFVGNIEHGTYKKRKALLNQAKEKLGLHVTRTNSGEEYLNALNNIRFFLSADIGFGENMIKNFEAMACGCVLIAYNHGDLENRALGFEDMKNIVLYDDFETLQYKLKTLRSDKNLAKKIAQNGQRLAENNFRFNDIGEKVIHAISAPLKPKDGSSITDNIRYFYRR